MSDEREEWDALVHSPGWHRLFAFVKKQYFGEAYQSRISAALAHSDPMAAVSAAQVVNRVNDELKIIMSYPDARILAIDQAKEHAPYDPSRRGGL